MARNINPQDQDILSFRPNIEYVEPDQQPGEITPISEDKPQLEDLIAQRTEIKQLAKAVESLATAVQAKADERAKGMVIALDPQIDYQTIQAMKRIYPNDNPNEITYEQYRSCKEGILARGKMLGQQGAITIDNVRDATRNASSSERGMTQLGGYNTLDSSNGGLRPELRKKGRIIEPIDLEEFQLNLMCILVNKLWKMFIKPIIPLPLLPDSLCKENKTIVKKMEEQKKQTETPPEIPTEIKI